MDEFQISLRHLTVDDYDQIKQLMDRVYSDIGGAWSIKTVAQLLKDFAEGQLGIFDSDSLVGLALAVKVDYKRFSNPHTYDDLVSKTDKLIHKKQGDALYGLDILIDPEYRGFRLGRRMYDARKELCREMNLRGILAGGRIPNYHLYANSLKPVEYIEQVKRKNIYDPILTFQLSNDFQVKRLLKQYLPEDERSAGYATLLEWNNFLYEPNISFLASTKSHVRIGVVQWQMRHFESFEETLQQVEYFVDALSDYQSDFALFPEFFNAPLMGLTEQGNSAKAIQFLASFTERFVNEMSTMAVSYNINIITGSMPVYEQGVVYNVAYLCRRDGSVEQQKKLHITPNERDAWVIEGGDQLKTFETDAGRIGILICYDVEFPELSRILANEGLEILFVPFWTDTKNGYLRVRYCAQARAIENECVVAIAGSVGNLPSVDYLDIQYAQSAIFSPSDFLFPQDAILAEATPNTEMVLFADIEMSYLKTLHNEGSVTNLKDRREDLYQEIRGNQT